MNIETVTLEKKTYDQMVEEICELKEFKSSYCKSSNHLVISEVQNWYGTKYVINTELVPNDKLIKKLSEQIERTNKMYKDKVDAEFDLRQDLRGSENQNKKLIISVIIMAIFMIVSSVINFTNWFL